jgi:hypothetical protein
MNRGHCNTNVGLVRRLAWASSRRGRRGPRVRRGAALLEVVIALSILLVTMSVVGLTFRNVQRNIEWSERLSRAVIMSERLLVEMDTGFLDMKDEREMSGWFGVESIPGMSWRVEINPHDRIDRLVEVDVHIYMGDPDGSEDERLRLLTTRVWRPEPRGLDLEKDFGLDEDQIDQLTEAIPGGVAIFDPTDFDPRMFAQLDMEMLSELLPTLIQAFGGSFMGGDLGGLLQALESGDMGALEDLTRKAGLPGGASGLLPGGGRGGQGPDSQRGNLEFNVDDGQEERGRGSGRGGGGRGRGGKR